jgi:glycosyltransferase involved in cell wall biosynthesis
VRQPSYVSFDVSLTTFRTRAKLPTPSSTLRLLHDACQLHALLLRLRPDIVNVHFPSFPSAYFFLLKPLHSYRIVVSTHGSDVLQRSAHLGSRVMPYLLRNADWITSVSQTLDAEVNALTRGSVPSSVIGNGIDLDYWMIDTEEVDPLPDPPIITSVGTLRPLKGYDVLLRAFAQLSRTVPQARLWLLGDGPQREELEGVAVRLEIHDRVEFHGWCPSEEVRRRLRQSTVFAFPSRSEGFGLALLEAMATGLPVVASRVGGIPEIVTTPDHGLLVDPEAPTELAAALRQVLCSPDLRRRLSSGARNRAQDFGWETVVDAYERVFLSLVS